MKQIFGSELLHSLHVEGSYTSSNYRALYDEFGHRFQIRPLDVDDYLKGYLELISDDDSKAEIDFEKFKEYLCLLATLPDMYYSIVVEDIDKLKVIGTGMLIVEQKFIHQSALRGRIENVIVNTAEEYNERGMETLIVETLALFAEKIGCYKVNISCPYSMMQFCEKIQLKFELGQNIMRIRFPEDQNGVGKDMLQTI